MTYDQLVQTLIGSSHSDWLRAETTSVSDDISTFRPDLDVTVRLRNQENYRLIETEEWATKHPDRNARVYVYELWYRASFVKEYHFASVDGGRAMLPFPKSDTDLTISPEQYAIARAIDSQGSLDEYLDRSAITIRTPETETVQ